MPKLKISLKFFRHWTLLHGGPGGQFSLFINSDGTFPSEAMYLNVIKAHYPRIAYRAYRYCTNPLLFSKQVFGLICRDW